MFDKRDKFTQYLEDMIQDFRLKSLGEKPSSPLESSSEGLWSLADLARGALLLEYQRVVYLLSENYLRGERPISNAFQLSLNLEYYYQKLRDRFDSLTACLTHEQRGDRRMYDVALCLEIYVLSTQMREEQGRRPLASYMDFLMYLLSELSVAKKRPLRPLPEFSNSLPTLKVKPQSLGGKKHSIRDEIIFLIRLIPNFPELAAKDCWNYLEENISDDQEMKIEKYSFTFSRRNNELIYSWVSSTTGLESEKSMTFKTFQAWFSKAKNLGN